MRLKPRYNPEVNQWWMCDEGRYGYKFIDENRITQVQVRDNGAARPGSWSEALDLVASKLRQFRDAKRMDQVGVILSSHLTNEDLYVAKRVCAELGITQVVFQRPKSGGSDDFLIQSDKSPNAKGAQALGIAEGAETLLEKVSNKQLRVLFVFTQDLTELFGEARVKQAANALELLIFVGTNANKTAEFAHLVLPSAVCAEKDGTLTNVQGRVQRIHAALNPWGESKPDWQILLELAAKLGVTLTYPDAPAIFAELASREPAFQGLSYQSIGDQGAMLKS